MEQNAQSQQAETGKQKAPAPSKRKQKQYPGERKAGLITTGLPEEEQERTGSDSSGTGVPAEGAG
jgi:hypothetical protein